MSLVPPSPHHSRCGPSDLIALVRVWEWEETVRANLRRVIDGDAVSVAYQPIYRLQSGGPTIGGYEAFARFPAHPRIPTRLWFHVAAEEGMARDLDMVAARKALSVAAIPRHHFLALNSTPSSFLAVLELIRGRPTGHVLEVGYVSLGDPETPDRVAAAQDAGVKVAIDDVPLADLHRLEPDLAAIRPDMVKVDLLGGLVDEPMARFNLASGIAWSDSLGIELVAERVERPRDMEILAELGVPWAQGYGLERPGPSLVVRDETEAAFD